MKLDKITLARWIDQALEQSFTKKNIKFKFKTTCLWPFNFKSNGQQDSTFRNIHYNKHQGNEDDYIQNYYIQNQKVNHNQNWGEKFVVIEVLHVIFKFKISKTIYSNV